MNGIWRVGNWSVNLSDGWLRPRRGFVRRRIYPDSRRLMMVLEALMANPGKLVSTEQILAVAWTDRVVSRDSVSTAIYQLRQLLGDDSSAPAYILTEPRRGYRLIAQVLPQRERLRTWPLVATVGSVALLGISGLVIDLNPNSSAAGETPQLYVVPLENVTGDPELEHLSVAMDASLVSALVRLNPRGVAARLDNDDSQLRLESQVVACDSGPVLVVRLLDLHERHYSWSRYYPLYDSSSEPSVVEHIAREVTEALSKI